MLRRHGARHGCKLKACFSYTVWEVFNYGSLDEMSTVITHYIDVYVQTVITSKKIKIYLNNKKYITKDVKQVMHLRKSAFKKKDTKQNKCLIKELKGKYVWKEGHTG